MNWQDACLLYTSVTVCPGKYMVIVGGDTGAVRASLEAGKAAGGEFVVDTLLIPSVHEQVFPAISDVYKRQVLPAIEQGLKSYGIDYGTPFFVKYGRVGAMDQISEITGADVTCVLIGERPGLITAESMSAYIAYKATVGMPEARRTVVSNIHKDGTIPAEAGAHIADIIKKILDAKASGTDLKL